MRDKRTILNGHGVGDYVSIGNSFLHVDSLDIPVYKIEKEDIEEEYKRLDFAIDKSVKEIEDMQKHADNNIKNILSMHILMLKDKVIIERIKNEIKEKLYNAEYIYDNIVSEYLDKLSSFSDKTLSERASDIVDIKSRVIKNLIQPFSENSNQIPEESIREGFSTLKPQDD